jgi:hypothetical protein
MDQENSFSIKAGLEGIISLHMTKLPVQTWPGTPDGHHLCSWTGPSVRYSFPGKRAARQQNRLGSPVADEAGCSFSLDRLAEG